MANLYTDFYGDDIRWFIGTVVSISDPLQLGRIKVRVHGVYDDIPDENLPYAQTVVPITEGGTNGLGNNVGIQPNARVFGVFMDGKNSQSPLVLGSMPKFENNSADFTSTSQLAVGTNTLTKTVDVGDAPSDPYAAEYPNNAVHATKSGHVIEIDDTPDAERIHIHHKSGSFIEIHPDGKIVVKAGQGIFIDAGPKSNIKATDAKIEITGTIDMTASKGDIVVDGISLVNHTHRDNPGLAGAITTPPLK
jgi:hypothetical protein